MEKLTIKTRDLTPAMEVDGLDLKSSVKDIQKFYGIPATLHTVDSKFKTTTFLDVVKAATPELNFLTDGNKIQLLDPKSTFIEDEQFMSVADYIDSEMHLEVDIQDMGFQKIATVKMGTNDTDNFLKDAFSREWKLTRKPEGGTAVNASIVRLACSNGLTLPDKQYSVALRNALPSAESLNLIHANTAVLNIDEYLNSLFTDNGVPVPCSFADLLDMQNCLASLTTPEYAQKLFPCEGVAAFYEAQGIETSKLARKWLDKLPTGLTYYQALQILTNGAKSMVENTIDNQVKVARFCAPKRMKNMKDTSLTWNGAPTWSKEQVAYMMGDVD